MKTKLELYYDNFKNNIDMYFYLDIKKRKSTESYFDLFLKKYLNEEKKINEKLILSLKDDFNKNKFYIKKNIDDIENRIYLIEDLTFQEDFLRNFNHFKYLYKVANILDNFILKYNIEIKNEEKKIKNIYVPKPIKLNKLKKDLKEDNSICFFNLVSIPYSDLFGIIKKEE